MINSENFPPEITPEIFYGRKDERDKKFRMIQRIWSDEIQELKSYNFRLGEKTVSILINNNL